MSIQPNDKVQHPHTDAEIAHEAEQHHHHSEECVCSHEHHHHHDHGEACACGHDHAHEHHHGGECDCGHDHAHEHHHHHDGECDCGHDHHHHPHEENAAQSARKPHKHGKQRIYTLQNLGCAHCAAEMQYQIGRLDGVHDCTLVFETRQLRVTGDDPDALLPRIREICASIEGAAKVIAPEEDAGESGGNTLAELLIGAALFLLGEFALSGVPQTIAMLAAYALLGWRVLLTAVRNIGKGRVFDENFLMALATVGAWAIGAMDEAVGVMLFYRIGEYFENRAVERSRRQIMAAVDLRPETVQRLLPDGSTETAPAADAQVGDLLLVRPGDRIPLDGVVVEGVSRLDTSAVTGEPVPVRVAPGDRAVSGCVNTDGVLHLRVTHVLAESMVQRILDSVENAAARKPKIDRFITRFSRVYTPAVVAIALLTALVPGVLTGDWGHWVYTALTFLVISCPCALVLSVPLTYFAGIGAGSKRGILFKGGASLEALGEIKTVIMDKTGTVTKGNFAVQQVVPAANSGIEAVELLHLAAACEAASTHPIAKSILAACEAEIPAADSVREQAGEGVEAVIDGKAVLCGNRKLMARHGIALDGWQPTPGSAEVLLARDGKLLGHIAIADTVKADAGQAMRRLRALGLTTAMLTGDAPESARAVADALGIDEVRARLLPEDKLEALDELREKHGAALFVGDGINDAPVLAGADVGAAMGSGADAAIEAADVVYLHADLSAVPDSVGIARRARAIAMQNIVFALGVKLLVMALGLAGIASMWLAVFADTGVAMLCVLNAVRMLYTKAE